MKNGRIWLYAVLVFSVYAIGCKSKKAVVTDSTFQIEVMYTEMPCGGAAPPDEVIQEMERPKPLSNRTVYVAQMNNEKSAAQKFKTDKAGIVTLDLDTGMYQMYLYDPTILLNDSIERTEKEDCERFWKLEHKAPFGIFRSKKSPPAMFFMVCNPCEEPRP